MTLIPIQPVETSPGVSITGVSISAIIPHAVGVTVFFNQGFSIILADKNSEAGYGNLTIDKNVNEFSLEDIILSIPEAISNKFSVVEAEIIPEEVLEEVDETPVPDETEDQEEDETF